MVKPMLASLMLALTILVGCSSEGPAASTRIAPQALLLGKSDLPHGATPKDAPPELCGPLPILKHHGAKTAVSRMFTFGRVKVAEAVGVFDSPGKAATAYDALNSHERTVCISSAVEDFGPNEGAVKALPSVSLDLAAEVSLVRYLEVRGKTQLRNSLDAVAIKSGRCVAALLFLVAGDDPRGTLIHNISGTAAGPLAKSCK